MGIIEHILSELKPTNINKINWLINKTIYYYIFFRFIQMLRIAKPNEMLILNPMFRELVVLWIVVILLYSKYEDNVILTL